MNTVRVAAATLQMAISGIVAWISAKLGILAPVLWMLMIAMVVDYISGMLASKKESMDHPGDTAYGWNSKKGARGIIKKIGYLCVIATAMVVDYIVIAVAGQAGIEISIKVFFGLLAAVWYLLNELLSITENAGRMGAPVPEWLTKYIAVLKNKVESRAEE